MSSTVVPVLEIGGTHVTAALVDSGAGVVVPDSVRRDGLDASAAAESILGAILGCAASVKAAPGAPWGVAVPGPFDYARGIALFSGVGKFEALYGVDVRARLMAGVTPQPGSISFLNDADAFLTGEALFGAAVGHDRCVGITLGTGVGSAFLADGVLLDAGPGVPPEGRVDLLRIGGVPLEDVVSRRAIRRHYQQLLGTRHGDGSTDSTGSTDSLDVAQIATSARDGEPHAVEALSTAFTALGEALGPWIADFGATALVVGGSMAGSWDLVEPPLRAGITRSVPDLPSRIVIREAADSDHAALLGAAAFASAAADHGAPG